MTIEEVRRLQFGDEVRWNDPDNDLCSRVLEIRTIKIRGNIVTIYSVGGDYLECYAEELS